jgi:hypothetical protein
MQVEGDEEEESLEYFIERFQYNVQSARIMKSTNGEVTRAEIGNLFENFKTDVISALYSQLYVLQVNKK